jgi:hypothetical protein
MNQMNKKNEKTLIKIITNCRNPNLGFVTKAWVCKDTSQNSGVTSHAPGSVGSYEGMNPHTPKWAPTLGIGVPMDFRISVE